MYGYKDTSMKSPRLDYFLFDFFTSAVRIVLPRALFGGGHGTVATSLTSLFRFPGPAVLSLCWMRVSYKL